HHPLLSFFFLSYRDSPCPHSFPTRRSSDLETTSKGVKLSTTYPLLFSVGNGSGVNVLTDLKIEYVGTETKSPAPKTLTIRVSPRSEEHTSELQSRFDLVCRLLLEKKKNKQR